MSGGSGSKWLSCLLQDVFTYLGISGVVLQYLVADINSIHMSFRLQVIEGKLIACRTRKEQDKTLWKCYLDIDASATYSQHAFVHCVHALQFTYAGVGAVAVLPCFLIVWGSIFVSLFLFSDEAPVLPGFAAGLWNSWSVQIVEAHPVFFSSLTIPGNTYTEVEANV